MNKHFSQHKGLLGSLLIGLGVMVFGDFQAEAQNQSVNTGVQRRTGTENARRGKTGDVKALAPGVSDRMQAFFDKDNSVDDAELKYMRVIYRSLDLEKDQNAPLYFPEEIVDGNENLFRIIMKLLIGNNLTAYEYLDGKEVFTDEYKLNVKDMLDRFHILYSNEKGSTEKNPKYVIQESDVPANEVLSYYIIERWEYDTRRNKLVPKVEAICPVLHRSGDFGGEAVKYPMFWVKMNDIRPWLAQQQIFTSDHNNLATSTYDDFFTMNLYDGEIYKTRNLKNKSMMQLYPDPDHRKRAQDSIQASLDNFEKKLWTPSREEVLAAREAREHAEALKAGGSDSASVVMASEPEKNVRSTKRSTRRSTKSAKAEPKKETKNKAVKTKTVKSSSSSSAAKSVRRRKR